MIMCGLGRGVVMCGMWVYMGSLVKAGEIGSLVWEFTCVDEKKESC